MRNNTVYLLIGQRGAGKSHYSARLVKNQPGLLAVCRDEILVRLFGSVHTNPYTGAMHFAHETMHRLLKRKLSTSKGIRLVLDSWTGESRERKSLIRKLREYGADRIVALYFITPLEVVETWFWQKSGIAKIGERKAKQNEPVVTYSDDAPAHDYEVFHELASSIDSDGFDEVIRIDPRNDPIILA